MIEVRDQNYPAESQSPDHSNGPMYVATIECENWNDSDPVKSIRVTKGVQCMTSIELIENGQVVASLSVMDPHRLESLIRALQSALSLDAVKDF